MIKVMDRSDSGNDHFIHMIQQFPWNSGWSAVESKILIHRIIIWGWSIYNFFKVYLNEKGIAEWTNFSY